MENHNTGTINSSARYCLAKPGDKVRITKTHRAGIRQYAACEGDTFIITKVVDGQIPYGRWLQPSGVLAASELKLDGACCAIINGEFYKRFDAKPDRAVPEGAIPCDEPDPVTGHWPHWVKVAADNPADKWFVEARNNSWDDLPNATYEAIGPHFQKNPYGLDKDVLVRHGTISIDIPNLSFEGIRRGLELAAMEGIVFWHEGAPLCKIKRKDFGFKWPVTQDELNAEFGANNPDPCELVRRTAAMYSRHEFPTDMTKMFDAEHEATKEEAKA